MSARCELVVCEGPTCARKGSTALRAQLARRLADRGLGERAAVTTTICFGYCERAPNVLVCAVDAGGGARMQLRLAGAAGPGSVMIHGVSDARIEAGELDSWLGACLGDVGDPGRS
jgi:hypothetical protein